MEGQFKLTHTIRENVLVLFTSGYVNNEGGQKILQTFNEHFSAGTKNVVIDFAESKVVNSIGISFLIEIIEKLNTVGGTLIFTNLEPAIAKTLTIMGLFNFARQSPTVESAVKELI